MKAFRLEFQGLAGESQSSICGYHGHGAKNVVALSQQPCREMEDGLHNITDSESFSCSFLQKRLQSIHSFRMSGGFLPFPGPAPPLPELLILE